MVIEEQGNPAQTPEAKMALYTVSFLTAGSEQVSRFFQTKRAALNWAKWLRSQSFVSKTFVYEGAAGSDLIEEVAG